MFYDDSISIDEEIIGYILQREFTSYMRLSHWKGYIGL